MIALNSTPETPPFRTLLKKLVDTPGDFTPEDLRLSLNCLFTPDTVPPEHVSVFLTALHIHHMERRPELLETAASMLRERAREAVVDGAEDFVVDIVGTGGDGHNLFNVSTAAGIVAAGAGARVIKVSFDLYQKNFFSPGHVAWKQGIHVLFWLCRSLAGVRLSTHFTVY